MLLVHHRKAEIGEDDALLKERMRADGDVDCPFRQRGEGGAALRRLVAAGYQRDAQARALGQRSHPLVMLAGENLGRRHHRRLSSRFDHVGHRQERDDGLARADVALQQSQHALLGLEVGTDVVDRLQLRLGQRKGQGGLEAPAQGPFGDDARVRELRASARA